MDGNRLKFISKEALIEDSAGRRRFSLVLEEKIKEYEKRMICGSQCPYTLPVHILTEDGTDTAYYDFTGSIQLAEYMKGQATGAIQARENRKPVCSVLDALSGILGCIKGMENYLIFPERITIHPDVVFVDPYNGQVALAFYPCGNIENTVQSRILDLIDEMNEACHDPEIGQYLRKLKDFIQTRNPGLDGMIRMLGTMQREASYIYWNAGSFRKAEEEPGGNHGSTRGFQEDGCSTRGDSRFPYRRDRSLKPKPGVGKKLLPAKLIAIQAVFLAGLAAAFLSGAFDTVNFAGLAVIAAALDVWSIRKLRLI